MLTWNNGLISCSISVYSAGTCIKYILYNVADGFFLYTVLCFWDDVSFRKKLTIQKTRGSNEVKFYQEFVKVKIQSFCKFKTDMTINISLFMFFLYQFAAGLGRLHKRFIQKEMLEDEYKYTHSSDVLCFCWTEHTEALLKCVYPSVCSSEAERRALCYH